MITFNLPKQGARMKLNKLEPKIYKINGNKASKIAPDIYGFFSLNNDSGIQIFFPITKKKIIIFPPLPSNYKDGINFMIMIDNYIPKGFQYFFLSSDDLTTNKE